MSEVNWYRLNKLPLYVEMSEGQLHASQDQLKNLQRAQSKPHVLDNAIANRIIDLHTSQNKNNWVFFEQCERWRKEDPSETQLKLISKVEAAAKQLKEVNDRILMRVKTFKGQTIDSILAKDDVELGLEFLLGCLDKNK